jgi:hypothetical protein
MVSADERGVAEAHGAIGLAKGVACLAVKPPSLARVLRQQPVRPRLLTY